MSIIDTLSSTYLRGWVNCATAREYERTRAHCHAVFVRMDVALGQLEREDEAAVPVRDRHWKSLIPMMRRTDYCDGIYDFARGRRALGIKRQRDHLFHAMTDTVTVDTVFPKEQKVAAYLWDCASERTLLKDEVARARHATSPAGVAAALYRVRCGIGHA